MAVEEKKNKVKLLPASKKQATAVKISTSFFISGTLRFDIKQRRTKKI